MSTSSFHRPLSNAGSRTLIESQRGIDLKGSLSSANSSFPRCEAECHDLDGAVIDRDGGELEAIPIHQIVLVEELRDFPSPICETEKVPIVPDLIVFTLQRRQL